MVGEAAGCEGRTGMGGFAVGEDVLFAVNAGDELVERVEEVWRGGETPAPGGDVGVAAVAGCGEELQGLEVGFRAVQESLVVRSALG